MMMNLVVFSILLASMTSAQYSQPSSASPPGDTTTPEADTLPPLLERLFPRRASAGSWGQGLQPEVLALRCQRENQTVPNWLDPACRSYLACSGSRLIVELCLPESAYSYSSRSCLPVNQTNCTAQRAEFSARVRAFLDPFQRQNRQPPHFFAASVGNGSVPNNAANNGVNNGANSSIYNPDFHAANNGVNNGTNNSVNSSIYNPDFHAANNGANNGIYNPDLHAASNGASDADFHTAYSGADGGASDADFLAANSPDFSAADTSAALTADINAFYSAADTQEAPQLEVVEEEEDEGDGMLIQLNALPTVFVNTSNSLNVTLDSVTCQRLKDHLPELETSVNIALLMLADCPDDPCDVTLFRLLC